MASMFDWLLGGCVVQLRVHPGVRSEDFGLCRLPI